MVLGMTFLHIYSMSNTISCRNNLRIESKGLTKEAYTLCRNHIPHNCIYPVKTINIQELQGAKVR